MSMISELVDTLRTLSGLQNKQHHERIINRAADTIEALSAKLADMERSAEDCGGGWIIASERMPEEPRCIDPETGYYGQSDDVLCSASIEGC